jgi:FtsH-binding integral membrane protein
MRRLEVTGGVLLLVAGLVTLCLGLLSLAASAAPETCAPDCFHSIVFAFGVIATSLGAVSVAATVGLWDQRSWGRWLAVVAGIAWAIIVGFSILVITR